MLPLILLPGTLCDTALWRHQIESLEPETQITVGDLSGHTSVEAMARSVLADAPEQFALAGLSLGGIVALEIMRQAPERVHKLALLDSNPLPPFNQQLAEWQALGALAWQNMARVVARLLPTLIHPARQHDDKLVREISAMAHRIGPEAYNRQLLALTTKPDSRPDLAKIVCPTLVLVGRQDVVCPVPMQANMASVLLNAELAIIEECGHLSSLEQPEAVTAHLWRWLTN